MGERRRSQEASGSFLKKRTKKLLSPLGEGFPAPPFEGFTEQALEFFRGLTENQNKAWFDEHKTLYEQAVREPMAAFIVSVSQRLVEVGSGLRGDPKRAMFRIHRDVRFSANKAPYKSAAGCVFSRSGAKNSPGLLYFHLDPKGCFAASGFYHPEPDALHRMRLGLLREPKSWAKVSKALAAENLILDTEEALLRLPRGFEAAPPELEPVLKLKSWVVRRTIPTAQVHTAGLVSDVASLASAAVPLLKFGWAAHDRLE